MKKNNRLGCIGLLLLLPVGILITGGVLEFNVPGALVHPLLVMGGLAAALAVNLLAVLQLRLERQENGGIAAITLRIGTKAFNLAIVAIGSLLLATIVAYLFVENFRPR